MITALRDSLLTLLRHGETRDMGLDGIYCLFGQVNRSIEEVEQALTQVTFPEENKIR